MSYGRESGIANVANLKLAVIVLAFTTALNVILPIFISLPPTIPFTVESSRESRLNSQEGHPRDWDLPLKQVALTVEDSVNFQLDTFEGAQQWRAIQPPGDGYITLGEGSDTRRYRLAMFHALDCLDTVRLGVLQRKADRSTLTSPEAHLCLDYLRQTIQCRSDTQLEQVRSEYGPKSVQPFVTHNNCRDWSRVYAELEKR
ncbi:uncharacterized protein FOMMEDRAFT_26090 [Fomitiporia mediterranea MF3/22]|uniref:uncharacterized protein n=1 Tax=Fomitiporia mediterranea (strain MF3/22) TaxID=694068 RepID=UPI0004407D6D|nr:uncharacterized protein FOMMEDRAFT_26090 [Fomitiporia mediterranea MF3/22]EJD06939.1 hypothetical protein FOMMEDRAFT_26090 [Fomitiporia mediterranea MF3/22]